MTSLDMLLRALAQEQELGDLISRALVALPSMTFLAIFSAICLEVEVQPETEPAADVAPVGAPGMISGRPLTSPLRKLPLGLKNSSLYLKQSLVTLATDPEQKPAPKPSLVLNVVVVAKSASNKDFLRLLGRALVVTVWVRPYPTLALLVAARAK
jgi:hypothetical protein